MDRLKGSYHKKILSPKAHILVRAGCLEVPSRVASRSHVQVASRSQGTNFETKFFNFMCYFGPSDQNEHYHTPVSAGTPGRSDRAACSGRNANSLFCSAGNQTQTVSSATKLQDE